MRARSAAVASAVVAVGAATLMGLTAGIASASGPGECTENVNVRAEPRIDAPIVALCEAGTAVETGEVRNGFIEITDLGGWAAEEFISVDAAPASTPSGTGFAPSDSSPSGSTPSGSTPSGSTPSGSTPSGSTPSGSSPTDSSPTDSSPADSSSSDSAPSGFGTPADEDESGTGSSDDGARSADEDELQAPSTTGSSADEDASDDAGNGSGVGDEPADEIEPAAPAEPSGFGGLL